MLNTEAFKINFSDNNRASTLQTKDGKLIEVDVFISDADVIEQYFVPNLRDYIVLKIVGTPTSSRLLTIHSIFLIVV